MKADAQTGRVAAGIAVLVLLALAGIRLLPPYVDNWKLQGYLNQLADDPATASKAPEILRANVVNRAGALGLPVHGDEVRVTHLENAVGIEVLYVVRVDLPAYSVDLHFRPKAGGS